MTLRDLYLRVAAAVDALPAPIKAEIDAAFADHSAANPPAPAPSPAPAPAAGSETTGTADAPAANPGAAQAPLEEHAP